jgi:hypothetical protein
MFNLERSIAEWRKQMLAAGIKTPVPLEELESHLREEVGRQMRSGTGAQPALEAAIQKIGRAGALKDEFQKPNLPTVEKMRIKAIAGGVLTLLVGFIMFWAAVVQSREMSKMNSEAVVLFVLGLILVLDGAAISFLAAQRSFLTSKRQA